MKQTLMQLRKEYNTKHADKQLTLQEIANAAGVSLADAYQLEIGGWVSKEAAIKVVQAFSNKVGKSYTIHDVAFRQRG